MSKLISAQAEINYNARKLTSAPAEVNFSAATPGRVPGLEAASTLYDFQPRNSARVAAEYLQSSAQADDMILHLLANGLPAADIYPPSPEVQQAVLHGRH